MEEYQALMLVIKLHKILRIKQVEFSACFILQLIKISLIINFLDI